MRAFTSSNFPKNSSLKAKSHHKNALSSKYIPKHFKLETKAHDDSSRLFDDSLKGLEIQGSLTNLDLSSISKVTSVENSAIIDAYFEPPVLLKSPTKTIKRTLEWQPRIKEKGKTFKVKLK